MHLLTAECAEIYRQRLAPGGILAVHISNRSLNLEPVTRGLARYLGWQARMVLIVKDLLEEDQGESNSRWVLLTEQGFSKDIAFTIWRVLGGSSIRYCRRT